MSQAYMFPVIVKSHDTVQLGLMNYSCLICVCGHTLVYHGQVYHIGLEAASEDPMSLQFAEL